MLVEIVRESILDGHEKIAPVERKQKSCYSCKYDLSSINNLIEGNYGSSIQQLVVQHPDFIKFDGLPLPFHPDNDQIDDTVGDLVLYTNETNKEKLAHKMGLSKDALEDRLKHRLEAKNQLTSKPGISLPRPRPSG